MSELSKNNMDETQPSSDAASATRKRRSSILKSQRPPRTPLSELEFNVATPTDTAKSRRVSFSRRTGVAEFVTNEATTTWKNFYEEHNKSLESSGNESAANAHRPMSIGHIGKRIFDQQFEEVEIVDIVGNLPPNTLAQDFHTSLNNLNITQQLASLECYTNDRKLDPIIPNLELSSFTEKPTKVFGDELSIPVLPEMSNPIDINFSTLQLLNPNDKCDDLDEIVKDLKRAQPHIVCQGPLNGNKETSEYIEIDLNMTHIGIKNDDCDEMSITDTIRNPEVQEVSKSISSIHSEKKPISDNDWIVDKENIAINPYITPKESKIFAQNNASDKILVFDGKKLSLKSESTTTSVPGIKEHYRNTLLPDLPTSVTPKRKTIVLNVNDDLPNFTSENLVTVEKQEINGTTELKQSVMYNESDLSITEALSDRVQLTKRKTILFENNLDNISITQAVPAKVIINKEEKRKTVIFENNAADISMTQGVSTKISGSNSSEKIKTVVYKEDISFTQALPPNLILNDKLKVSQNRTMYYENDGDISVTQVMPENIISMVKDRYSKSNLSDISFTRDIPCNIINTEVKLVDIAKVKTCVTQENTNIEITQAVPDNLLLENKNRAGKRNTIVFENDYGDISITQALPANILCHNIDLNCDTESKLPYTEEHISLIKSNMSIPAKTELHGNAQEDHIKKISNKRNTIIYNDDLGDISMTHVIPSNIIMLLPEMEKMDISSDHDVKDISITRALSTNILLRQSANQDRDQLVSPDSEVETNQNIMPLVNLAVSGNKDILSRSIHESPIKQKHAESLKTQIISVTTPSNKYDIHNVDLREKPQTEELLLTDNLSMKQDILIYQAMEQKTSQSRVKHENNYKKKEEPDIGVKISRVSLKSNDKFSENHADGILSKTCYLENIIKQEKSFEKDSLFQKNSVVIKEGTLKTEMPVTQSLKLKKTFLNELLDMSNASLNNLSTKSDICVTKSQDLPKILTDNTGIDAKSSESLFVIIQDTENDLQAENVQNKEENNLEIKITTNSNDLVQTITKEPLSFIHREETEDVQDLQNKIAELKALDEIRKTATYRHYETIVSVDSHKDTENFENSEVKGGIRRGKKSFKNADDTRELLGILSDFTDGTDKNDKTFGPLEKKDNIAIDNKCEQNRLSFISKQKSEVLNKDLRHSISMAQAVLQQSRYNVDDESIDDTNVSPEIEETLEKDKEIIERERSRRKSVRMSTEVVKTLQFEEEDSISDVCMQSDMNISPLKKTAFGETSYMRENKAKVIPTYLKDVSDNIKALMSDLVKPMADVLPFDAVGSDKSQKESPSTCSTQIQANLITSSQIDIDVELHSNPESANNIGTSQCILDIPTAAIKEVTDNLPPSILPTSITASMEVDDIPVLETSINRRIIHSPVKGPIIVFDQTNPLNNILLASTDNIKAHKYNPIKSTATTLEEHENPTQMGDKMIKENNFEVERLSTHCDMENRLSRRQSGLQLGDTGVENIKDSHSIVSNLSKPISLDQSTEGFVVDVKNIEVNTVIAMKPNMELLEASSSLTLVDDALAQSAFDLNVNAQSEEVCRPISPLKVIYQMETDGELQKIDSDMVSKYETINENNDNSNPKKRSYSPTKRNDSRVINISQDLTPVPVKKIQKMSNSPRHKRVIDDYLHDLLLNSDKLESVSSLDKEAPKNKSKMKPQKSTKKKSPKRNEVIIQHVTTEYSRNNTEQKTDEVGAVKSSYQSSDMLSTRGVKSMEIGFSFTSSKDAKETQDTASVVMDATAKDVPILNWQTKLVDDGSLKIVMESRSNYNVVDRINMLKCMGRDCEWESSSGDVWTFRMLQSQIRLTARLAHTHHNASRSRVLADTPLEALSVDQIRKEVKDPLGVVCLRFATEAMRYECSQERCSRASDVTALLKRCAAIARVALSWARVMRDSRLRLAYSITPEGDVSLKVANISLRTVWEVTLRVDLVVGDAQEMAWPRAGRLRVHPVLADSRPAPDLTRLVSSLRKDWSHVPATIWTVFRYLKNKTTEDDPFL